MRYDAVELSRVIVTECDDVVLNYQCHTKKILLDMWTQNHSCHADPLKTLIENTLDLQNNILNNNKTWKNITSDREWQEKDQRAAMVIQNKNI